MTKERALPKGLGFKSPGYVLPVVVVFLACVIFTLSRYAVYQDWLAFVDYDGYFNYHIARWGFDAQEIAPLMDELGLAYRYQRIVYPITAYALTLGGHPTLSAFFLVALNIVSITAGTYFVILILESMAISPWYSLIYGLYGGQFLGLMTSLSEPMAYLFVTIGIFLWLKERLLQSAVVFAIAALTKEVALLFVLALVVHYALEGKWKSGLKIAAAVAPYALWQIVLLLWLGESGLTSGQPFEFPLWGWLSGLFELPEAFLLLGIILVPMSYLPMALLGLRASIDFVQNRNWHPYVLMVVVHVGFMLVLPRWTAREPVAMLRITQGLMIAALMYGGLIQSNRILNYSVLWIATLAILVQGSGRDSVRHFP